MPLEWRAPAGRFVAISAGDDGHACGLRPHGETTCWGHDYGGGRTQAPPGRFVAVSAGKGFSCGLHPNGEASCWGTVRDWDLSDTDAAPAPATLPGPFTTIQVANASVCGLRPHGEMTCWDARTGDRTPTPDGVFAALTSGTARPCGLRPNGQAECWTPHWPPTANPAPTPTTSP